MRCSMKHTTVSDLPHLPGVYIFKDAQNTILYIGKAKSLKKRVSSYFIKQAFDWKIDALIKEHASIEHIVTHDEQAALILEAQLVKEYQPKYNTLLKEGSPFLYILFTEAGAAQLPEMRLVRHKNEKGTYFGPFTQKQATRKAFDYLARTFRLRLCKAALETGCLNYHLGYCAGNCRPDFSQEEYSARLQLARLMVGHEYESFKEIAQEKIAQYTKELAFEKALHMYEYLKNFETIAATVSSGFSERAYRPEVVRAMLPSTHLEGYDEKARAVQELLKLATPARTIDCFDISHFQGRLMVGSCVRFTDGKPDKNKFRRFKIKTVEGQDDYASLAEIVQRRYRNGDLPDLIVIDGGKGQRNAVKNLVPQVPCMSLAKREERIFSDRAPEGIVLDLQSPAGQLLVALRDYAHHFAIEYHRKLRKKEVRSYATTESKSTT